MFAFNLINVYPFESKEYTKKRVFESFEKFKPNSFYLKRVLNYVKFNN